MAPPYEAKIITGSIARWLHLLQKLDMHDLRLGSDPRLLSEMGRLQEHEKETIVAWQEASDI
ncbi:hypothetical protein N7471_013920 [Penicillium samsonianum]|uniref:uncharacterized protein n=1 Tax=Penicillium samsonianum TaxID=1882272 RepID=UPI002546AFF9|nr:uncharacterized protein N7471_013920 [Penicillium samsonianum]KAJ6118043.1 hypothetical protein N7471_013920 [Penicillium samsonianum]